MVGRWCACSFPGLPGHVPSLQVFPVGCVQRNVFGARGCAEYTAHVQHTSDYSQTQVLKACDNRFCCVCPCLQTGSSLTILYPSPHPRNLKLKSSRITIYYPPLNASLMQAIKDFNVGKHIARLLKALCVKGGRGE